jgi:hypothetical protein
MVRGPHENKQVRDREGRSDRMVGLSAGCRHIWTRKKAMCDVKQERS